MARVADRGQKARVVPIPAPVGGLNARDTLAAMPALDAETLLNMNPYGDRVETRGGCTVVATKATVDATSGNTDSLYSMFRYSDASSDTYFVVHRWRENVAGTRRTRGDVCIFSPSGGTVTFSQALVTYGTTNSFNSISKPVNFTDAAGNSWVIFVGVHTTAAFAVIPTVWGYSGGWSNPAITGLTGFTTAAIAHQKRLWFLTSGVPGYLPVGATAGAIVPFNVAPQLRKGGYIVDMQSWPLDNGVGGLDDKIVFLSNQGEIVVYEGNDPSSAATWRLVGVFDGPRPATSLLGGGLGGGVLNEFAMRYGNDILLLASDGLTGINAMVQGDQSYAISAKIRPLLAASAKTYAAAYAAGTVAVGTKMIPLRKQREILVAFPTVTNVQQSSPNAISYYSMDVYRMHTETGAWTKWTGLNVLDGIEHAGGLYFIDGSLRVYSYDGTHTSDNGAAITFEARQAYNFMQHPGNKQCTLVQPMLKATGNFSLTVNVDADYNGGSISTYTAYAVTGTQYLQPMLSGNQYGRALATHMKGQTSAGVVSWYSTNVSSIPAAGL